MCPAQPDPYPTPNLAWTVDLGQPPGGPPLVAGELLLVPTSDGALHALSLADGSARWQAAYDHARVSGLAWTAQGLALVATYSTDLLQGEGELVALDATGTERWRWSPGVQRVSAPATCGDVVCVTLDAHTLVILDALEGKEQARTELEASASPAAPALGDDVAYLPCRGPHLLAVGLEGAMRWHFHSEVDARAWLDTTPILLGDHLFVALSSGAVLALRREDGSIAWRADVGPAGKPLSPLATDGARLFAGARDGLYAIDLDDGRPLWHLGTDRRIAAAPIVADGVVYAAGHDHHLYALDACRGEELWRVAWERRIEVAPAIGADRVLAAGRGGRLTARERVLSAEAYEDHGRWAEAAIAHLHRGHLPAAARVYDRELDQPLRAAELWVEVGDLAPAAGCYARAGLYDQAEALYRQLGQALEEAKMARLQGQLERAAAIYEREEAWAEALDCYLALRERSTAPEPPAPDRTDRVGGEQAIARVRRGRLRALLVQRLTLDEIRTLCLLLEVDYDTLPGEEQRGKVRELILHLVHRERLIDLVEVARVERPDVPWEEALERAERPPPPSYDPGPAGPYARQIAELAARLGQWEREGRERAALGEYDAAVAAFLRAVRQAEQDCPRDEDRLAELWAAAEACCDRDTELSETHLPECRRQVARYRRLPYIEVEVIPPETMVLNQYAEIEVKLRNTGGGGASQIVIHHTGSDFAGELGETQTMPGLRAGGTLRPKYSIYPEKPGHAPLKIEVEYSDATGRVFQAPPCRVYITVVERGSGDS